MRRRLTHGKNRVLALGIGVLCCGGMPTHLLAGFSGPGGPRLNYDRPPTIAPYDKSVIPPNPADAQADQRKPSPSPRAGAAQPPAGAGGSNQAPQTIAPRRAQPSPAPRQIKPPRNNAGPKLADPRAAPPRSQRGPVMQRNAAPQDADQRRRLLTELYGYLSKAKSPDQATRLSASIERLWLHSESATTSLLMRRTDRAIETGRWRIAERFADAIVKLDGDYTEGLMRRAYIRYQLNQPTRALRDLRRVLTLEPNHFIALDRIGAIQSSLGEHKAALKSYRKLKRINPKAPGVSDRIDALVRKVDGEPI